MKKTVVIGLIGTTLDAGLSQKRWDHWRPSVSIFQQDDLLVDRFDMIFQKRFTKLAEVITQDIHVVSPNTQVVCHDIEMKDPWDFEIVYSTLKDFSETYSFDTEKNDYLLHITTGTHVAQICTFLLNESKHLPGRLLQTSPSPKKNRDPRGTYSIIDLDLSKYDKLATRFHEEQLESLSFLKSGIETKNKQFNQLIELIERVAIRSREPILIMGPTGAGKSQLASRIYDLKKMRSQIDGPFISVNCATIRGDGSMSALFGHTKGAFTGAQQKREGYLSRANGGILFLDEIGELGLDEQAMLLHAIEHKTYYPVGSDQAIQSDFQLIAGTNRSLQQHVQQGLFREDLLARINLWSFDLPGLVERREDIEPNLEYELKLFRDKNHLNMTINKEAKDAFLKFARASSSTWKGNFRDLNSAVIRMGTLAESGRIDLNVVKEEIARLKRDWKTGPSSEDFANLKQFGLEELDLFEKVQLEQVIEVCKNCQTLSEAGRKLFSNSRESKAKFNDSDRIKKYLAKYNLNLNDLKNLS